MNKISENTKIVVIGGGTGNSVLLKEFKKYTENITAIVSVADDGGSSGHLRKDFNMLPPGDIRNCISALADDENIMTELMNFRFDGQSVTLKKHAFGNIFIAAMNEICSSFPEAIRNVSEVLAIKGRVLPVTEENINLYALLSDGSTVKGESQIPKVVRKSGSTVKIDKIYLTSLAKPYEYAFKALEEADIIIFSPGSLYTSLIPNILVEGIAKAISENSAATKVYVMNIMTQYGETDNFNAGDHIRAIEKHVDNRYKLFDYVIYNTMKQNEEVLLRYKEENAFPVSPIYAKDLAARYEFIGADIATINSEREIRHNSKKLIDIIMNI